MTAPYEKLILDVDILQHMMEILQPLDCSEEALGLWRWLEFDAYVAKRCEKIGGGEP
ncbi:MAG: hypothetical protein EOS23_31740 [Mesorhizobium sp.]|uniref:hypothetical protein n=1 Tax=Mesorhizobium sp. TaxID=1871066 RepID=UPI000FE6C5D7|nr:MAG: hypothetical protein EOS23_31740 [Mesorhizobium sp.]TIV81274.1 MAG: hypothetical protein E5V64_16590 [Mesorhizobium sp.]